MEIEILIAEGPDRKQEIGNEHRQKAGRQDNLGLIYFAFSIRIPTSMIWGSLLRRIPCSI